MTDATHAPEELLMPKVLRYALAVALWLPTHIHDRMTGVNPPASFRQGIAWARGEHGRHQ